MPPFPSPVIAARPFTIPYLTALLPSELEMQQMEETDSSEQEEQPDAENLALHISTVGPFPRLGTEVLPQCAGEQ